VKESDSFPLKKHHKKYGTANTKSDVLIEWLKNAEKNKQLQKATK